VCVCACVCVCVQSTVHYVLHSPIESCETFLLHSNLCYIFTVC